MRLSKLFALVPVTDELAADAGALERYIGRKTSDSIRWKTNLAIFQGSGAGQPLGFFGHVSQVNVAAEGGQAAGTIVAENVAKMFARQIDPGNSVWLINNDAYPQLFLLNKANQMLWSPDFKVGPGGALLGRPVILTQLAKSIGANGDINFVNLKYYRAITKAGAGIETATSLHLYFDVDMMAFRATFRVDGQPAISAAVAPNNGAATLSPFVAVAAR
jgi:HK97 family phage major capsid protein